MVETTVHLASDLASAAYVRERYSPQHGDPFYLHLADLREALASLSTEEPLQVLDYGCGGSPYRSLFPKASFHRADIPGDDTLDYLVHDDGTVNAPSAYFDLVLSSQVLEHVCQPQVYLRESTRVLRSGGRLVLSTHGLFIEHGCPHDYRRWTADGLRAELDAAGFQQIHVTKLTCGTRALLFCLSQWTDVLMSTVTGRWQTPARLLRGLWRRLRPAFHRAVDLLPVRQRLCPAGGDSSPLYVALLAVAVKPSL